MTAAMLTSSTTRGGRMTAARSTIATRGARGAVAAIAVAIGAASCNGTTGDELVTFSAFVSGAPGAGEPFSVGAYTVQLTTAKMLIGALYFDESPPSTGAEGPVCITPGVYAAQVPGPVEADLLSTSPQEFSVLGNGTADAAESWQLWLASGDVNATVDPAHIVDLEGVATDASGHAVTFGAVVTINTNRLPLTSDPAQPGANPICKQRIIQIGGIDVPFFQGGTLHVTVDPRAWFKLGIDFGSLPAVTNGACLSGGDPQAGITTAAYALSPEVAPPGDQTCGGSGQACCAAPSAECLGSLACTAGICGPGVCIPDSDFVTASGGVSADGAAAGVNLFTGIQTGGPAAYSFRYSSP